MREFADGDPDGRVGSKRKPECALFTGEPDIDSILRFGAGSVCEDNTEREVKITVVFDKLLDGA